MDLTTFATIKSNLEQLATAKLSREAAADWASQLLEHGNPDSASMQEALFFLSLADLKVESGAYLYSSANFAYYLDHISHLHYPGKPNPNT